MLGGLFHKYQAGHAVQEEAIFVGEEAVVATWGLV